MFASLLALLHQRSSSNRDVIYALEEMRFITNHYRRPSHDY